MVRSWAVWAVVSCVAASLGACGSTKKRAPSGAEAGAAGDGPTDSNSYVDQVRQTRYDQLDLLLVVDNSAGMGEKQRLLAEAVPRLVSRLVSPRCVDAEGTPTGGNTDVTGSCAAGQPELTPVNDIHVGVISSSLGSHGATGPDDACVDASEDDHGHLLADVRGLSGTYRDLGFLAWDTLGRSTPPGDSEPAGFAEKLNAMLTSAGEAGCRQPATLEAWYRFLIDPEPAAAIVVEDSLAVRRGIDDTVLAQRAAFLRPQSVVAIVLLSDKNDCSVRDDGYGWLVAREGAMYRSTSQCLANPNDPCCQSCGEQTANAGCPAVASDSECQKGQQLASAEDAASLRCFQQKRRFGFELLYPIARYADALRSPVVPRPSTGELVQNPLFAPLDGTSPRDKGAVFLAGIVGVPWQDIADDASQAGTGLRYLTAAELSAGDRWAVIVGDPAADPPVLPTDPLMIEATADRTTLALPQVNPITQDSLVPSSSPDPQANRINGHEHANVNESELQYACIFPLAAPRDCDLEQAFGASCECGADAAERRSPLCQPPEGGEPTGEQYYAKAYPGLRHLQLLKEFGDNAVVASVCPQSTDDADDPAYGYLPAIESLVTRVKEAFKAKCFPRELPVDGETGQVACQVVEVAESGSCNCEAPRTTPSAAIQADVRAQMQSFYLCGVPGAVSCDSFCLCEIPQLSGDSLDACQTSPQSPVEPGFCYLNAQPGEPQIGNPDLLTDCSADAKRLLRFVGDTPARGSTAFVVCDDARRSAPER